MTTNNAQLFLANFNNYDLFQDADPDALKDFEVNDVLEVNEIMVTNGGTVNEVKINKAGGVDESPIPINLSNLKNKNISLYKALKSGSQLGSALFSRDNETTNYSKVTLGSSVMTKANPASYSSVPLKFFK